MSAIKPSSHGIVVENKVSGLRYASTDANYDPKTERKVRDLKNGETVIGFPVKPARPSFTPVGEDDDSTPEDEVEEFPDPQTNRPDPEPVTDLNTEDTDAGETVDGQ